MIAILTTLCLLAIMLLFMKIFARYAYLYNTQNTYKLLELKKILNGGRGIQYEYLFMTKFEKYGMIISVLLFTILLLLE